MSPRVERWLAHVRKQLPGPMYDHPRKPVKPWDAVEASKALEAWRHRWQVEEPAHIRAFQVEWRKFFEGVKESR